MSNSSGRQVRLRPAGFHAGVRSLMALGLVLVVVTACSATQSAPAAASATPTATPTPTPTPTPVPTPTRVPTPTPIPSFTDMQLQDVCGGMALPQAAPYAGTVHPLVVARPSIVEGEWVVEDGVGEYSYAINMKWSAASWAGAIQLVVCADNTVDGVKSGTCGSYKRSSDGKTGQVILLKQAVAIRVVVARTGKTLQSKTLLGSAPKCSKTMDIGYDDPPWYEYGGDVTEAMVNAYAVAVSTQKA